jgi:hypothetical protein
MTHEIDEKGIVKFNYTWPLSKRIEESLAIVANVASTGRHLKMSIPAGSMLERGGDEDILICDALRDAKETLEAAERAFAEQAAQMAGLISAANAVLPIADCAAQTDIEVDKVIELGDAIRRASALTAAPTDIRERVAKAKTWCPECGYGVRVDEDGLCVSCGSTAIGRGVDQALALLAIAGTKEG